MKKIILASLIVSIQILMTSCTTENESVITKEKSAEYIGQHAPIKVQPPKP